MQEVQALYDAGLYLQALARADSVAPLAEWRGAEQRVLAGRLALRLGGQRLGETHHLRAMREPDSGDCALYYAAAARLRRHGPWATWRMLACPRRGDDPQALADLLALEARIAGTLRDFELAERRLQEAEALRPDHPWLRIERANVLELQDRYDEALAIVSPVRAAATYRVAAVAHSAHLLQLLGRDDDAERLLQDALASLESSELAAMLALQQEEHGQWEAAFATLARFEALAPLLDESGSKRLAMRRVDLLLQLSRDGEAAAHAAASGSEFHREIVARAASGTGARIQLAVPFVRQHHRTCGPATLTALALWHGRPTEQLHVIEDICYGGTTDVNERRWALRNGFAAREFTLNAADAKALLARGLPFAVATREATSGHLQAVIGIDERRGTFIVRDPFVRQTTEWLVEQFLQHCRASGPRAMVLAPHEDALAGMALQDSELYDQSFAVQEALARHDRAAARRASRELAERHPEHRLAIEAQCALSAYERDAVGVLSCVLRLLEQFPEDSRLLLRQLECLAQLERRDAALELLRGLTEGTHAHPAFLLQLAWLLQADGVFAVEVRALCERALRRAPLEAHGHRLLGRQLLQRGCDDEALQALRFAVCLDDTNEAAALEYFEACRTRGRTAEGIALLEQRFERYGRRAGGPARSLFHGLQALHRPADAFVVLERALRQRPQDGALLLFAAEAHGADGRLDVAAELRTAAAGHGDAPARSRTDARLAMHHGDLDAARGHWLEALQHDPLEEATRGELVRLLRVVGGPQAAVAHLQQVLEEYPFHRPTARLLAIELGRVDTRAAIRRLDELAAADPSDALVQRELALRHLEQSRPEAALAAADAAVHLQPHVPDGHAIRGKVLQELGRRADALAAFAAAVQLDVDCTFAIGNYVWEQPTAMDRRRAVADLAGWLAARAGDGPGMVVFAGVATSVLEPEELLVQLRRLLELHPHSWAAHGCVVQQLVAMQRGDEALPAAQIACDRFPLLPRVWLDLAAAHRSAGDEAAEMAALERARELLPWSPEACRALAALLRRRGETARALAMLRDMSARAPDDNGLRLQLCETLVESGDAAGAAAQAAIAIGLDVTGGDAWGMLQWIAQQAADPALFDRIGRPIVEQHAVAVAWLQFAVRLPAPEQRLAAFARCLEIDARNATALDLRAALLAECNRVDEAIAELDAVAAAGPLVVTLRGRRAWLIDRKGNRAAASAEMRAVLAERADYTWGRQQLVEWLSASDDRQAAVDEAQALVDHAPADAVSFGWLGATRLAIGQRAAAKEAFAQALSLAPCYGYAAKSLLDLHLENGELDAADAVVDRWLGAQCDAAGLVWRLMVAGRRVAADGTTEQAVLSTWQALCRRPDVTAELLAEALQVTPQQADSLAAVQALLAEEAVRDEAPAAIAGIWCQALGKASDADAAIAALRHLSARPAAWHAGAQRLLGWLGTGPTSRARRRRLARVLAAFPESMWRADDGTLGLVLYALLALGTGDALTFCSDWRRRAEAEQWVLHNVATALRVGGRWDEARAVSAVAVERRADDSLSEHRVWLAIEALLIADLEAARMHHALVRIELLSQEARLLAACVDAWLAFSAVRGAAQWVTLWRRLRDIVAAPTWILRRCKPRLVRAVAAQFGWRRGPWLWLWLRLSWLRTWWVWRK